MLALLLIAGREWFIYIVGGFVLIAVGFELGKYYVTGLWTDVRNIPGHKEYNASLFWDGVWPWVVVFGIPAIVIYLVS